jgi:hypothetical protein
MKPYPEAVPISSPTRETGSAGKDHVPTSAEQFRSVVFGIRLGCWVFAAFAAGGAFFFGMILSAEWHIMRKMEEPPILTLFVGLLPAVAAYCVDRVLSLEERRRGISS